MPYKIEFNDSAVMTAPTLGDLTTGVDRIKVVSDYVYWANSDGYWFSQAGSDTPSREFGVWRSGGAVPRLEGFAGGTRFDLGAMTIVFGGLLIEGKLEFNHNLVTGVWELLLDDVQKATGTTAPGTARTPGALFRIGGRADNTTSGSTASSYLLQSGEQIGDTRVYIDTGAGYVLERDYVIPSTGTAIPDNANAQAGTMQGTFSDAQLIQYGATGTVAPSIAPVISGGSLAVTKNSVTGAFTFDSASNTGDAVAAYEVRINGAAWSSIGIPDPLEFTEASLSANTTYDAPGIEMRATNAGGSGPLSTAVTFTTAFAFATPTDPVATNILSNSARLTWVQG